MEIVICKWVWLRKKMASSAFYPLSSVDIVAIDSEGFIFSYISVKVGRLGGEAKHDVLNRWLCSRKSWRTTQREHNAFCPWCTAETMYINPVYCFVYTNNKKSHITYTILASLYSNNTHLVHTIALIYALYRHTMWANVNSHSIDICWMHYYTKMTKSFLLRWLHVITSHPLPFIKSTYEIYITIRSLKTTIIRVAWWWNTSVARLLLQMSMRTRSPQPCR